MNLARLPRILPAVIVSCVLAATAGAEVMVTVGPTPIPRGDATGVRDITVSNDLFAVAFAVESAPPWGVARGGIVDIAILSDGEPGFDIASLADFMPDNWSSWPTSYQRVTVEKHSPHEAVIRTERDWGDVELETTFHIRDGDSKLHIVTRMTNRGEAPLNDLLSGYVVWPDGGYLIEQPIVSAAESEAERGGWTAAYDELWLLGLHAPFAIDAVRDGRDRYKLHNLAPDQSATFEAWLQIEGEGALAPMVLTEIESRQLPAGNLSGRVTSADGEPVMRPAVVVSQDGKLYAWALGNDGEYSMRLPTGDYDVYVTASGYASGGVRRVSIARDRDVRVDFDDVRAPGKIRLDVADAKTGRPLDARISVVEGYKPLIGYFGKSTFFTELDRLGKVAESIAPGSYVFEISAGGGFTSRPEIIEVTIEPGRTHELEADIDILAAPRQRGWYSADLHHHSDVLDGFTSAEYVLRSELAAGVDLAFLSDHDSVINNAEMQSLAAARGVPFIPGTELSPSWGHFNAYPLDDGRTVDIDTGQATVQELFAAARGMGADVIEVNHPYSEYGYFENHEHGKVPGGYDAGFDLVEIQPVSDNKGELARNRATLERVWQLWNEGHRAYLAAGSDVHDVWRSESAEARTYVYVEGDLSVEKFIAGLKRGHAFASQGPLVYPDILFGSELAHVAGKKLRLAYVVEAVSGLSSVTLIERGTEVEHRSLTGSGPVVVEFFVMPEADTWYGLVVEDDRGRIAATNPVWVSVDE